MPYLSLQPDIAVSPEKDLSDEDILRLSLSENPELFSEIVRRYREPFLRKARYLLRDGSAAEDAVQEAFVKMYIKGARFKILPGATFQSWAYKVLINTCLSAYRTRARRETHEAGSIEDFEVQASHADFLDERLSLDAFLSILSRLPKKFSALLKRFVLAGHTSRDVADEEGVSEGAIRTRFHRAKKAFEKVRVEIV